MIEISTLTIKNDWQSYCTNARVRRNINLVTQN